MRNDYRVSRRAVLAPTGALALLTWPPGLRMV